MAFDFEVNFNPKPIPVSEFLPIYTELLRQPLEINKYRNSAGKGRTQAFGIVGRRSLPPDYSRNCWLRPFLYKLLIDFGYRNVPFSFNAITINQDYQADKHRDKHNVGKSFLVAFGEYDGGELEIHEGDLSGVHNICHRPIITDFSKVYHSVTPFIGRRFSLVYYNYDLKWKGEVRPLPLPYIEYSWDKGKWEFWRGLELIDKKGLPHPLRGRVKKETKQEETPEAVHE